MCETVRAVLGNDHCPITSAAVKREQLCDGRLAKSPCLWDVYEGARGWTQCFLGPSEQPPGRCVGCWKRRDCKLLPAAWWLVNLLGLISSSHHTKTFCLVSLLSCERLPGSCVFFTLYFFDREEGLHKW